MRRALPVRPALALACAVVLVAATGCTLQLSQLSFRTDKRLQFLTPKDRALVTTPVTVSWTMRDFTIQGRGASEPSKDAGYFALFVDRAPIKPGQTLKAVASDDQTCKTNPKCPDASYLAQRQVYTTTKTSFVLKTVNQLADTGDDTQLHDVTIVLLDSAGRRIGESQWNRSFKLKKRSLL